MHSPFPVPLDVLAEEHLRAFLAAAEEEGVNWEAKADGPVDKGKQMRPEHVRNGACALANQIGGHFIVGALMRVEDGERKWELVGVAPRDRDPGLWLDRALRELRPVPRYRHRVFPLEDNRWAAVIEVQPLVQTPCMTADGQVFERVSSESIKVTDPVRLHELFSRGERARERAEAQAARAAQTLHRAHQPLGVGVTLALAAASYEPDIGSRLFHSRFRTQLDDAFEDRLFRQLSQTAPPARSEERAIRQSFVQRVHGFNSDGKPFTEVTWRARAQWDGAVAVSASLSGSILKHGSLFEMVLLPAWRLAADLVGHLGGYSDARMHLAIEVRAIAAYLGDFYRGLPASVEVTRWSEVAEPSGELVGSVQRELQRAAGLWSFEGEPDPPPGLG
jgi:hypothetical protein